MKMVLQLGISLFVGFQACIIQILDQIIHQHLPPTGNLGFSWISFLAWATYFMVGCNVQDGLRAFIGFITGILASICIMEMAGVWSNLGFFAAPIAIFIIATLLFLLELAPRLFSLIPAFYISAAAFFACMMYVPNATYSGVFFTEMLYLCLGLFFGWKTIAFRTWYESAIKGS